MRIQFLLTAAAAPALAGCGSGGVAADDGNLATAQGNSVHPAAAPEPQELANAQ